ncbi:hypothetical protein CANARDRAFT_195088 [[Candida] arabinofermentans NRRL YB-2248]|uniref:Xaa-Pro dipeptidyl-peptidase C-terminal domain-containing protein n=1 Tax=[Candida] arabinofermentans NRRL YB-2248 TaxID=983967 RepID=A0A1E4T6R9_9ASCO|nr:hypothetical protein CANARDRAFT_195088 [[Candida] arabinofermentans NRRL YB-2248]
MAFNVRNTNPKSVTEILTADSLPYEVTKLQDIRIPMKDGAELQAHIWIPTKAWEGQLSVGTLVEYIPYRTDVTIQRDSIRHSYYSGNGLASIRIDMRGASSSDGLLLDEYILQEQDDCLEAFDWIIQQKWSNGNIGMFGKSWGGFNGLQVAARQHPALKTIITLMSTDDRYSDDVHYRGGCMLASDMLWWGSTMLAYTPRPQDPKVVGDKWKENFLERLDIEPMVKNWVTHQTRDDYWKHGSICEDYSKVDIPVLAVGGWRDGYTNPVFRMVENLPNPDSCGLVGPWVHEYPEMAEPAPKIGYQQLSLEWFTKYLHPEKNSTFTLPRLTAYVQDPSSIADSYVFREGKWVSVDNVKDKKYLSYYFSKDEKLALEQNEDELDYQFSGDLAHGMFRGTYCPFGFKGDFPSDQKLEDSKCLCFDSPVISEDSDLLGQPVVKLTVSSDKKLANLSVRLVDMYPNDGEHVLISWGQLNLSHRQSDEFPEYLEPGKKYDIKIGLDVLGIKLEKGHKLRVALSTCDWPQSWPSAETPSLKLFKGELILPLVNEANVVNSPDFASPTIVKPIKVEIIQPYGRSKTVTYDYPNDSWNLTDVQDSGAVKIHDFGDVTGIYNGSSNTNTWKISGSDPLSAYNECKWTYIMGRDEDNWHIKLETSSVIKADKDNFYLTNKVEAYENEKKIADKLWDDVIPRGYL